MNYKSIPYATEWIEYPNIKATFESFGMAPNDESVSLAQYSIPAVRMTDGACMMDSRQIANALEAAHPEPSLHLDSGHTDRAQAAVLGIWSALTAIAMPRIPELLLNPQSADYFPETREKRFGMPLSDLAKSERAGEHAWKAAGKPMGELKAILHEYDDGPYVMGKQPSYADFMIAGMWRCFESVDQRGDLLERAIGFDVAFSEQYQACRKWLERDDH